MSFQTSLKTVLLFFIFLFLKNSCISQTTSGKFFLFKADKSPATDEKDAAFLLHIFALNDTTYISRYYRYAGPMIRQKSYKDSSLTIPNGRFCWYNTYGELDSSGTVINGKKDGFWDYIVSETETYSVKYSMGIKTEDHIYYYDKNGKSIGNDTTLASKDTFNLNQVTAKYKKGVKDWVAYCKQNLKTPRRLQNVLIDGMHTSIVSFLIDKQGYTNDIYLLRSCEWSGDAEVMRLIADSPRWQPATQNGLPVFCRQKQSLSFNVVIR